MRRRATLNLLCSIVSQIVAIISGLVVPRLILSTFGSEVNGLISSLTQFLNYIALIEGGLGSVVLAALYSPLALGDSKKLGAIIKASNKFFKQIAYIYLVYSLALGFIYPFIVKSSFSLFYVLSLTMILSVGLFIQFFFSINYKLLLQADQRMYIVQIVQIVTTIINIILVMIVIRLFPNIHIVKLISATIYVIQPLVYSRYVEKNYVIERNVEPDQNALSQRWNGFGQNIAFFIHNNTDVIILSMFCELKIVSVYSVYYLIVSNLRSFIFSLSNAFTPMIGKSLATHDDEATNRYLDLFEFAIHNGASIIYGCCICLLPQFVVLYTQGVNDVDYYRPVFSIIIILAFIVYCFREPYIAVVNSAGKFKETEKGAYLEAIINIGLSVALIHWFNLVGIAIGTLTGITFRLLYLVWYIHKNVIYRSYKPFIKRLFVDTLIICTSVFLFNIIGISEVDNYMVWIINGVICILIFTVVAVIINWLIDKNMTISLVKRFRKE